MNFFEFNNIRIAGMATAVPNRCQKMTDYIHLFEDGEVEKFCAATGIYEKYIASGVGTTASDLCVEAADNLFEKLGVDKSTIDGLIMITQTPDYSVPPTSCVVQYRLGLDNCGLVYDSNIGCSAFPFGLQMACANITAGCKKILLLVGDSNLASKKHFANKANKSNKGDIPKYIPKDIPKANRKASRVNKDGLLFGDAGIAVIVEKTEKDTPATKFAIDTIGREYKSLIAPYGMERHPLPEIARKRGFEFAAFYNNEVYMSGADVFTLSIKESPRVMKAFMSNFSESMDDYDLISLHQANKMIVDNVAKRIKAPKEKVINSIARFGNTRGSSTMINICDYAEQNGVYSGEKKILTLAYGIGFNVAIASFTLDFSKCLPIIKTNKVFDDGIDSQTYFN